MPSDNTPSRGDAVFYKWALGIIAGLTLLGVPGLGGILWTFRGDVSTLSANQANMAKSQAEMTSALAEMKGIISGNDGVQRQLADLNGRMNMQANSNDEKTKQILTLQNELRELHDWRIRFEATEKPRGTP